MESKALLKQMDRAAAAPFTDYPETPWWYPVLAGGWLATYPAGVMLLLQGRPLWAGAAFTLLTVPLSIFFGWYMRRRGTSPRPDHAPAEIRSAYRRYFGGMALIWLAVALLCWLAPLPVAVGFAFGAFTVLTWWYERRGYPAACEQVRARLA